MAGCFSWCPGSHTPQGEKSKVVAVRKRAKKDPATPTTQDYVLEASSKGIKILKSSLDVVGGIPGAQGVLELALVLIETCQDLTEIEEKVSELKDHIEGITLAMVKAIEGKESRSIPQDLLDDINKLRSDLETIKRDLDKIAAQSRLLIVLFKTANKAKVERCMELLKSSLVHWDVSRDISHSVVLHNMEQKVDYVQETVGAIQKSMGNLLRQAHTATHAATRQMPPKPVIFYGRDGFVDDVVEMLVNAQASSRPPRICIHGPGGMGKTSTAIAVMEHPDIQKTFSEENRFWVPCVSATSPDILLHILYSNLRICRDTGDFISDIVTELQSSPAPRLMLLDNFETPWDPVEGSKEDVEDILHRLSALSQLSILVTMRTNIPPSEQIDWIDKPLGAVDRQTSKEIYIAIHPRAKGKPKLDELLAELGHMPFAITLVATLGKRSKAMPEALLKDWRKYGPGMLSSDESVEDSISRSIGLSLNSKTIAKNAPARTLLAVLAMLPAGTTHSHLDWWVPELGNRKKNAAISALSNVALIIDTELEDSEVSEVSISVLPVVQSYMQHGERISPQIRTTVRNACFKFVLDHKSSPGDPKFKDDLKTLSSEESNLQSILLEATKSSDTVPSVPDVEKALDVLLAFSWYQHWTKPRTEIIEHTLKLARKAQLENYIAEALFCLASTLFRLDRYDDACQSYIEARDVFRSLSNTVRTSECSFELVELYQYKERRSDAERALDGVSETDIGMNRYVRARAQLARGRFCWFIQKHSEALKHLTAAKEAFESPETRRPVDAAYCLHSMARSLGSMHRWKEALEAVDRSLELYATFGPDNRLVETLLVKDYLLLRIKAPAEEVIPTLERTLQKGQELGRPLAIAQALELTGEFYARQRNARASTEYYTAAEAQFKTITDVHIGTRDIDRCRHNIDALTLARKGQGLDLDWDRGFEFLSNWLG